MDMKWFRIAGLLLLALGVMTIFVAGCAEDDDDDDDDQPNDFEDLPDPEENPDDYSDGYDEAGGGPGCGCEGCEGCSAGVELLGAFALAEDVEALFVGFGADEGDFDFDLDELRISEEEWLCFESLHSSAVGCTDAGLNCLWECEGEDCRSACVNTLGACIDSLENDFALCPGAADGLCADYRLCAEACDSASPGGSSGSCLQECMVEFEACAPLFGMNAQIQCVSELSFDLSFVTDLSDLVAMAVDYASCAF